MSTQWILLANASIARLFSRASADEPLVAMATMHHPQSRLKGVELGDDRAGHQSNDTSHGGTSFEPRNDQRHKEHHRFAVEVAKHLDAALQAGAFGSLWILASAPFLGELKAQLSHAVAGKVQLAIDTDLTSLGLAEIEQRLSDPRLGKS